jgi:hypothetical protein
LEITATRSCSNVNFIESDANVVIALPRKEVTTSAVSESIVTTEGAMSCQGMKWYGEGEEESGKGVHCRAKRGK